MPKMKQWNGTSWATFDAGAIDDGTIRITPDAIGILSNSTTTDKTSLVNISNEINLRRKDMYFNVKDYYASGSSQTTTGSITTGTNILTLASAIDFVNGQNVSVIGIYEVASLSITAGATSSANCTVTLNGVAFTVALTSGNTATQVATAIRAATFSNWTTGGSGTTVTFTSTTTGNLIDATYSAGTTGATGTVTTTTQGSADLITTITSGAGTTTLVLATNASATVSGVAVTHDDTVAIQNTINAANTAGGGTVFFLPTTYIISGLTLYSNVNLIGVENVSTLKLKPSSISQMITGTSISNFTVSDLILDGNKTQQNFASGLDVVKLTNCSYVKITDCEIKNGYSGHGIELVGCSKIKINANYLHDNGGNGVVFTNTQELEISDNRIGLNSQRGISDYGTTVNGSSYITIEDNTIYSNTLEGIGFNFADSVALTPQTIYAEIHRNLIRQNALHGIVAKCNYSTIVGNQVFSNGNASDNQGIVVQANYTLISSNIVDSNKGVGIDLGNCLRCVVSDNLVANNGNLGIEVNSTEDTTVDGNVVLYNNAINYSVTNSAGIMVHGSTDYPGWTGISQNVTVTGNRVVAGTYQTYGIYVDSLAKYITISDNALKTGGNTTDIRSDSSFIRDTGNITGASEPDNISLASAYDFVVPISVDYFQITGTTTMNTIKFDSAILPRGKRIVLEFTAVLVVNNKGTATGNIHLTGSTNLTVSVGTTLELICNGTEWKELARSVK